MNLLLSPRISEKSYGQSSDKNTYIFTVPLTANKIEVKKAVETEYLVEVLSVNILKQDGKKKVAIKGKRHRPGSGKRSDFKKAYVRLKEGQTIPVFANQEGEDK